MVFRVVYPVGTASLSGIRFSHPTAMHLIHYRFGWGLSCVLELLERIDADDLGLEDSVLHPAPDIDARAAHQVVAAARSNKHLPPELQNPPFVEDGFGSDTQPFFSLLIRVVHTTSDTRRPLSQRPQTLANASLGTSAGVGGV